MQQPRARRPRGASVAERTHRRVAPARLAAGLATWAIAAGSPAAAERPRPPAPLDSTANLDGWRVWLGPVGAASWSANADRGWDSAFGARLDVLELRAAQGLSIRGGGLEFTRGGAETVWTMAAHAVIGTRLAGRTWVGAAVGPMVRWAPDAHATVGASASLWVYAGVAPFARVRATGDDVRWEFGLAIPLPAVRLAR